MGGIDAANAEIIDLKIDDGASATGNVRANTATQLLLRMPVQLDMSRAQRTICAADCNLHSF